MARKWIVGPLLVMIGLLHLFGFLTSWDLIEVPGLSRTPTILTDDLPVGVIRDIGALWLLVTIGFALAGYGAIEGHRWWKGLTFGSALVSLVTTLFWIHEAWPLTLVNLAIIALIALNRYRAGAVDRVPQTVGPPQ